MITICENARTVVNTKHGTTGTVLVKAGVCQRSLLSPLLLVVVMEILTSNVRDGLYADELVLVVENMEMMKKVIRIRINKAKVKVSLSMVDDMLVCKLYQPARDGDGSDVLESIQLRNGVCLKEQNTKW